MSPTRTSTSKTRYWIMTLARLASAALLAGSALGLTAAASSAEQPGDEPTTERAKVSQDGTEEGSETSPDQSSQADESENLPPVTVDDEYITAVDRTLVVEAPGFLGNDHDPDGSTLTTYTEPTIGEGGVMYPRSDGSFRFEPAPGFMGTATFEYWAIDADDAHTRGTITIHVLAQDERDGLDTSDEDTEGREPADEKSYDDSCPDRADCANDEGESADNADPETDSEADRAPDEADDRSEVAEAPPAPRLKENPTYTG